MYLDTMQQIYSSVTKVLVESRQGSNMLYLPLDRILQQVAQGAAVTTEAAAPAVPAPSSTSPAGASGDARTRDNSRTRERETR
jgi:modulator of FtsH protease HflK